MTIKSKLIYLSVALCCIAIAPQKAVAQFYVQGTDNIKTKWQQQKSENYKIIYPKHFETTANRIANLLDTLAPTISYGMIRSNIPIPIVLETNNQYSNGMVTWAPKRMELVSTAPTTTFATPWLRQLAIHEYRHAAQISNLKVGLGKVAGVILGEAGIGIITAVVSTWQFEGDATNAETQLTEYGRGLQPSFTLGYRAIFHEKDHRKIKGDQYVSGSFKNFYPNHYEYGYQIVRATETYLHPKIWGDILNYSGRNAVLVIPDYFYLKYKYKTSFSEIRERAFSEMDELWEEHSSVENNYSLVLPKPKRHTKYSYPIAVGNGTIFTIKDDFNTPSHIAVINDNAKEKASLFTGTISSRPTLFEGRMYWTEYQPSRFYAKENYSVIRSIADGEKKPKTHLKKQSHYFVTPAHNLIAAVANDSLANGYMKFFDSKFKHLYSRHFDRPTTLHSLAWDEKTNRFAFIALDDTGMYMASVGGENPHTDTLQMHLMPSSVTISDLTASNGALYFHSIQSGKDEIHTIDITTNVQRRLTRSQYGAKAPSVTGDTLTFSSYTYEGWVIAQAKLNDLLSDTVEWSRLPKNILNPKWVKWQLPKGTANITISDTMAKPERESKRFRRFSHMFNMHSWAPIAIDAMQMLNESQLSMGLGGTAFFQSTLGDFYGNLAIGSKQRSFWTKANFTYAALPVKFSVKAEYGGGDQAVIKPLGAENPQNNHRIPKYNLGITASLPVNFSSGSFYRNLQPSLSVNYYNTKLHNESATDFRNGYEKWNASLWWGVSSKMAYREMLPRWGYAFNAAISGAFTSDFANQYNITARTYLPGIIRTHSTTLKMAYMMQNGDKYNFTSKPMTPRGVVDNTPAHRYSAYSADYLFPLVYPDWGWDGVASLKRLSINAFADFSRGWYFNQMQTTTPMNNYSYGLDLNIDLTLIRSFDLGVVFQFAMPNNEHLHFGLGFNAFF